MWKITNKLNTPYLYYYNKRVIVKFFDFFVEVASLRSIKTKILTPNFLEHYLTAHPRLLDKRFLKEKKLKESIEPLLIKVIQLGSKELDKQYKLYLRQNRDLYKGNYDLKLEVHPDPLISLFKDYFYDVFWGRAWMWKDIVKMPFNRTKYKENFQAENKLTICPYCDADTIASSRNGWIEHFLPRSKFPYVCCNPRNLVPSCTSCNVSGTGKGTNYLNPMVTQFQMQIGDLTNFQFKANKIIIDTHTDLKIENFLTLLQLRKRYQEPGVHAAVISTFKATYELILKTSNGGIFDDKVFLEFIGQEGRHSGRYFVRKDILKQAKTVIDSVS
jgi:hypothetical protein